MFTLKRLTNRAKFSNEGRQPSPFVQSLATRGEKAHHSRNLQQSRCSAAQRMPPGANRTENTRIMKESPAKCGGMGRYGYTRVRGV